MVELIERPLEERRRRRSEAHRATTFGRFVNRLSDAAGCEKPFAVRAAIVVLGCLEQRLSGGLSRHLEAQLPARLRERLAADRPEPGLRARRIHREELLTLISEELALTSQEAELLAREVLATVRGQVSDGEARRIEKQLPTDLRELWSPPL